MQIILSQKPIPITENSSNLTEAFPETIDNDIKFIATGDIMLGRSVNLKIQKKQNYAFPFQKIQSLFNSQDVVLINLESPFGQNCPQTDTGMVFCADQRSLAGLKTIHTTHANLANNHIGNQKTEGINLTANLLTQNLITPVGLSTQSGFVVTKVKDTKIAFIGFDDIPPYPKQINQLTASNLTEKLKQATKSSDFQIVIFHWGNEYQMRSKRQQEFARLAIDSGADLIIGHHPHWVQEIEEYKGVPIFYSLGNFVFDQMWSQKTREGIIANITIKDNKVSTYSATPIFINKDYQPELVNQN